MGLAAIAVAGVVVSAAAAGYSAYRQNEAEQAQSRYLQQVNNNNKKIAENNAILAERAAEDARIRGQENEDQSRSQTQQLIGRIRAASAANGVEVGVGSALDLEESAAELGELDALTIRSNAEREAIGFENQASNIRAGVQPFFDAGPDVIGVSLNAGSTAINSAGNVATEWYALRQQEQTTTA